MLILNEKKEAELILKSINSTECKITQVLNLMVRYFVNESKLSKSDAINETIKKAKVYYGGFNEHEWMTYLKKTADSAKKKPLRDLDSIPITQNEIDAIKTIDDFRLQKLAFSCLVISKMNLILHDHNWISVSDRDLFRLSNNRHVGTKFMNNALYELYSEGFISFSNRIDSTSKRYEKIYDDHPVFHVSYLTDLGYWWSHINGEKFKVCEDCGRLFKPASNVQKYCFIHSAVYNKPTVCTCEDCGREFEIEPGRRKRKRCECCNMDRRLKQYRDSRLNKKIHN